MNKLLMFFGFLFLTSCSIQYDGNTRLQLKTKIVKSDGTPLAKSKVKVNVYGSLNNPSGPIDIISIGTTNENGEINILFPSPDSDKYIMEFVFFLMRTLFI